MFADRDLQNHFDQTVQTILDMLELDECTVLKMLVTHWDGEGGFMFGFHGAMPVMTYLEWDQFEILCNDLLAQIVPDFEPDTRSHVVRYQEYCDDTEQRNLSVPLKSHLVEQWKAIEDVAGERHSGASWGLACRTAQKRLRFLYTPGLG